MTDPIMVPIDLAHKEDLEKAIEVAVDIARIYKAPITLVSVTEPGPTAISKSEPDYAAKLEAFAKEVAAKHQIETSAEAVHSVDVPVELGDALIGKAADIGAMVIVMASHIPGFLEHIFASNAGYVASHAKCSVFVVR